MAKYASLNNIIKDLAHLRVEIDAVRYSDDLYLGRGNYSDVKSGECRSLAVSSVAIKRPHAPGDGADAGQYVAEIISELETWASLKHPGILPLQAFWAQISVPPRILYLSPLAEHGNISKYRRERGPSQLECLKFVLNIGEALCYLHEHAPPLVHGDVHPRHILINDRLEAILCDFRLMSRIRLSLSTPQVPRFTVGSPSLRYLSPEIVRAENNAYLTTHCDVWSLGCLVAGLFTGVAPYRYVPFEGDVVGTILSGRSPFDGNWPAIPPSVQTLLRRCWEFKSVQRPPMPAVVADLRQIYALYSKLETLKPYRIGFEAVSTDNDALGEGRYGTVYRGMHGSVAVAVKKIRRPEGGETHLKFSLAVARELTVWAGLQHPHILPLHGFCLSDALDRAWLLSPLATLGDINKYVTATQADQLRRLQLILELTKAVCYLHSLKPAVCHGDIKPANVLIKDTHRVVLCDFGLSRAMSAIPSGLTTSDLFKGSMRYLSPEVLDATSPPFLTVQSDIWAWGCSVSEILTGLKPHPAATSQAAVVKSVLLFEKPADLTNPGLPLDIRACLEQCWRKAGRPPLSEHLMVLERICEVGYKPDQRSQNVADAFECINCQVFIARDGSRFCSSSCSLQWKSRAPEKPSKGGWELVNGLPKPVRARATADDVDWNDSQRHPRQPAQNITKERSERSRPPHPQTRPSPSPHRPNEPTPLVPLLNTTPPSVRSPALANVRKPGRPTAVVNYPTEKQATVLQVPVSMCKYCGVKPQFVEQNPLSGQHVVSQFCGITCRDLSQLLIDESQLSISAEPVNVSGGSCDLFVGKHVRMGRVALKRLRCDPSQKERAIRRFEQEGITWSALDHPHVLRFLGICKTRLHVYLVAPFVENGALHGYLKVHSRADRARLLYEVALAVEYLHRKGVLHGDIKAANILVSNEHQALLCDFGLAKFRDIVTSASRKGGGTLRWQSPELVDGGPRSAESDVYAYGMLIYEVLSGNVPFVDYKVDAAVYGAIFRKERPSLHPRSGPDGSSYKYLWDVAEQAWAENPKGRPRMANLLPLLDPASVRSPGRSPRVVPQHSGQTEKSSSSVPLSSAVERREAPRRSSGSRALCAFCHEKPIDPPRDYCSRYCGLRDAWTKQRQPGVLTLLRRDDQLFKNLESRFTERWRNPRTSLPQPTVYAILQITLPVMYEKRFTDALYRGDGLGGATTKSVFFGGLSVCDVGISGEQVCTWGSCAICVVIQKGFDVAEYGQTGYEGSLGKGIYAHTNPAMADRFTAAKTEHEYRAMIVCSVVVFDDYVRVRGDRKEHAAVIEDSGRVYCAKKDFIIPRQLIIYRDPYKTSSSSNFSV